MCLSFLKMAGRRSALQWRKLARQNCLRGRAARYVAAAALWLVAACGCCLALLLPLTMLLGVLVAVLLADACSLPLLPFEWLNCVFVLSCQCTAPPRCARWRPPAN